jgi:GNAT superfamily N-acetyltransferase
MTEAVAIRDYEDADEPGVLQLLTATLGAGPTGGRTTEFWHWKHIFNPFGRSPMLVAEDGGRIVGLRAFMRWEFHAGGGVIRAARAVDTATHPDYQGRGLFSRMTSLALDRLREDTQLIFNTPNDKSLPGYLKLGWQKVGAVPIRVRVRRPFAFIRGMARRRSGPWPADRPPVAAEEAHAALKDHASISALIERREPTGHDRLATPLSAGFLAWRYGMAPGLDYKIVMEREGERLRGIAIFRVRSRGGSWESTVAELLVEKGDVTLARSLLGRTLREAAVGHAACHFPPGSMEDRAARRSGFVTVPGGMTLVVKPLVPDLDLDPTNLRSWALRLGDLEVF